MTTENFITKAGVLYVLAVVFGVCVSWKYCGCELMFMACYYLVRGMWHDITHG